MLSTVKLEKYLGTLDLYVKLYYLHSKHIYVEVENKDTADTWLLVIGKKYIFKLTDVEKYVKIHSTESSSAISDTVSCYAREPAETDINFEYGMHDYSSLTHNPTLNDISNRIVEQYSFKIDINTRNNTTKSLVKQITRLKQCVKGLPYKIALFENTHMCIVAGDNTVHSYSIEMAGKRIVNSRKILVCVDLTTLYTKPTDVLIEIPRVHMGVIKIVASASALQHKKGLESVKKLAEINKIYTEWVNKIDEISKHLENNISDLRKLTLESEKISIAIKNTYPETFDTNSSETLAIRKKYTMQTEYIAAQRKITIKSTEISNLQNLLCTTSLQLDQFAFENSVLFDALEDNINNSRIMLE